MDDGRKTMDLMDLMDPMDPMDNGRWTMDLMDRMDKLSGNNMLMTVNACSIPRQCVHAVHRPSSIVHCPSGP